MKTSMDAPLVAAFAARPARPAPPTAAHGLRIMALLGARELVLSKKSLVVVLLGAMLVLTTLAFRVLYALGVVPPVNTMVVFAVLVTEVFMRFFLPVVALFYGASLVTDEVDGRTLTYLTTRPLDKRVILCGKFAAFVAVAALILETTLAICWLAMATASGLSGAGAAAVTLLQDAAVTMLGILAYGGFFTYLGAALRKPVIPGLVFAFVWEQIASFLPGSVQRLTILHFLQSISPHPMAPSDDLGFLSSLVLPESAIVAVIVLLAVGAAFLALACHTFRTKEYRLEK